MVRVFYHASPAKDLRVLQPRVSNDGAARVYLSRKRENVLVYLSNAVERFCRRTGFAHEGPWTKWGPYGFGADGRLVLEEYYPDALEETYRGVGGWIYRVGECPAIAPYPDIPDCLVSASPVPVLGAEYVPEALEAILRAERDGQIVIRRYAEMTPARRAWLAETMRREYAEAAERPDYRRFIEARFPFIQAQSQRSV